MSRRRNSRNARRGALSHGPLGNPTAYGISGWTTARLLRSAINVGLPGTANTPLWREIVLRIDSQAVASATRYIGSYFTGNNGWRLLTTGTNGSLTFDIIDATVNFRTAPAYTITAGAVGKLIVAYGWWDGSDVRLAVNGAQVGAQTASATYAAPTAGNTVLGQRSNSTLPADGVTILGMRGGDGVKTASDALASFAAWQATARLSITGAARAWCVGTSQAGSVPNPLPDLGGVDNLTWSDGVTTGHTLETIVDPEYA